MNTVVKSSFLQGKLIAKMKLYLPFKNLEKVINIILLTLSWTVSACRFRLIIFTFLKNHLKCNSLSSKFKTHEYTTLALVSLL